MVIGVLLILGSGGLAFNRAAQRNRAFNPSSSAASQEEASAHGDDGSANQPPSFKAADYAGLDWVVIPEEQRGGRKQAEMEAIYGSSNTVDPNAGFAQAAYAQPSMSQASQQAASEAAALLSDNESNMTMGDSLDDLVEEIAGASAVAAEAPSAVSMPEEQTLDPAPAVVLPSVEMPEMDGPAPAVALPLEEAAHHETPPSSAVEIPEMAAPASAHAPASLLPAATPPPTPAPTVVQHTCTNCQAVFELDMPAGIHQAVVACPACGVDRNISTDG